MTLSYFRRVYDEYMVCSRARGEIQDVGNTLDRLHQEYSNRVGNRERILDKIWITAERLHKLRVIANACRGFFPPSR